MRRGSGQAEPVLSLSILVSRARVLLDPLTPLSCPDSPSGAAWEALASRQRSLTSQQELSFSCHCVREKHLSPTRAAQPHSVGGQEVVNPLPAHRNSWVLGTSCGLNPFQACELSLWAELGGGGKLLQGQTGFLLLSVTLATGPSTVY